LLLVDNAFSYFHNQPNVNELYESNKSNSDSEKISDNELEPETSTALCQPRLIRTNQDASNSHDNCGHGHDCSCSIGRSKGHYGSGYDQPYIISNYSNVKLTNIKCEFLQPIITAHLQPMNA
ncbi:6757_t:CDS:2, partial [Racocetra fulgida]